MHKESGKDKERITCNELLAQQPVLLPESESHIDHLNKKFGIPEVAQVTAGHGGLPKVCISTDSVKGELYLYGAHVTSWRPAGSEEVLFVSRRSRWQLGYPIRGGIPICFPWFSSKANDAQAPKHGFVRTREWHLASITAQDDGTVTIVCVTESDTSTLRWWPHRFRATFRVTFGKTLRIEFSVRNMGTDPMSFEEALHAYFQIGEIKNIEVPKFEGIIYFDARKENRRKTQSENLVFTAPMDRIYIDRCSPLEVHDTTLHRILRIQKQNSETTVIWNPWEGGARKLPDFHPDEWRKMLCIEPGNVLPRAVLVPAGEEQTLRVTLSVLPEE